MIFRGKVKFRFIFLRMIYLMLRKENLDIACVLTPPSTHREIVEKVAEYGVNVLVEKPMALTLEDAKAMITKCKKKV